MRCRNNARFWREAHSEVKMLKHHMLGPLGHFEDSNVICVAGIRDPAPCQKLAKREQFAIISSYNHYTTLLTLEYNRTATTATLHYTTLAPHHTPLHQATLHSGMVRHTMSVMHELAHAREYPPHPTTTNPQRSLDVSGKMKSCDVLVCHE